MNHRSSLHAQPIAIFYLASDLRYSSSLTGPSAFEEDIMSVNVTPQIHLIIALSALSGYFVSSSFTAQVLRNESSDTGSVEITFLAQ